MKLDDYDNKERYYKKGKEITEQIQRIVNDINEYQCLEQVNNEISSRLQQVEEIINIPHVLKEFDRDVFDSAVDKMIIGEIDENGNKNSRIIRFVLNTGEEKPFILAEEKKTENSCHLDWAIGKALPALAILLGLSKIFDVSIDELLFATDLSNYEVRNQ